MLDITRLIHPKMAIYPNNPEVEFEQVQKAGDGNNGLTQIELGTHTGTHIDAPSHIHGDGKGMLSYSLEQLNGDVEVIDLSKLESVITADDIPETFLDKIIFKTRNSDGDVDEFNDDFVALDDSAAEELVKRGIKMVGLDALSIRKRGTKNMVHETLIDNGIVVLEGLWLKDVEASHYELICMPLKVDLDGAPVRAVLRKSN